MACIGCGCETLLPTGIRRSDNIALISCASCNLLQTEVPSEASLTAMYQDGYFADNVGDNRIGYEAYYSETPARFLWQIAFAKLVLGNGPHTILDVGCATGHFLSLGEAFGWTVAGVDIAEGAVARARERGLQALCGDIRTMDFPVGQYDAVTYWDTIEHLADLPSFLSATRRLLKPTGVILLSTPLVPRALDGSIDQSWIGFRESLEHVTYFDRNSLTRTLTHSLGGSVTAVEVSRGAYSHLLALWRASEIPTPIETTGMDQELGVLRATFPVNHFDIPEGSSGVLVQSAVTAMQMGDWLTALSCLLQLSRGDMYRRLLWSSLFDSIESQQTALLSSTGSSPLADFAFVAGRLARTLGNAYGSQNQVVASLAEQLATALGRAENLHRNLEAEHGEVLSREETIASLTGQLATAIGRAENLHRNLEAEHGEVLSREETIASLTEQLGTAKYQLEGVRGELTHIWQSKSWRILSTVWSWRRRLLGRLSPAASFAVARPVRPDGLEWPLRKHDVVFLSIIDWNFRHQRPQHLALQLAARGHRVFYVSVDVGIGQGQPLTKIVADNVYVVHLWSEKPVNVYLDTPDEKVTLGFAKQLFSLHEMFFMPYVSVVVELPYWTDLSILLKDQRNWSIVYDCLDDVGGFALASPQAPSLEAELMSRADAVVTTSSALYNRALSRSSNVHIIRNGVEAGHFPPSSAASDSIIIGYYGAVAEWFDVDLVRRLALSHLDWQFHIIGDVTNVRAKRELGQLPNVILRGEIPYGNLPAHASRFSVCIIPFLDLPLTRATDPVKVYEYMAMGKPVVASALPELDRLADVVDIARSFDEWEEALTRRVQSPSVDSDARIACALENTWDHRGEALDEVLANAAPLASIIVISYNNWHYTEACLASLEEHTLYPNFEVIVVDNASSEDVREQLTAWSHAGRGRVLLLNDQNVGFGAANNQGIRAAAGEYIVLLNNDTVVSKGWLAGLVRALADPAVGIVCSVTNEIGNEAKIAVDYTELGDMPQFARQYTTTHDGEDSDIMVVPLFCAALRRDVLQEVGPLDERFTRGMFEDDDYSFRVRKAGYRMLCIEYSFVHHVGSASFRLVPHNEYQGLFESNKALFEEKWNTIWTPHRYRAGIR